MSRRREFSNRFILRYAKLSAAAAGYSYVSSLRIDNEIASFFCIRPSAELHFLLEQYGRVLFVPVDALLLFTMVVVVLQCSTPVPGTLWAYCTHEWYCTDSVCSVLCLSTHTRIQVRAILIIPVVYRYIPVGRQNTVESREVPSDPPSRSQ